MITHRINFEHFFIVRYLKLSCFGTINNKYNCFCFLLIIQSYFDSLSLLPVKLSEIFASLLHNRNKIYFW